MRKSPTLLIWLAAPCALFFLRCSDDRDKRPTATVALAGQGGVAGGGGIADAGSAGMTQTGGAGGGLGTGGGGEAASAGIGARVCTPGQTQVCVGPAACPGGQVCQNDGASWGPCDCGGSGAAGSSGGVPGASGGSGAAASGTAGDGPVGGGAGDGGGGEMRPCDLVEQTGCNSGDRCAAVYTGPPTFVEVTCIADGSQAEGVACNRSEDGSDDCVAGTGCSSGIRGGLCRPYCDPSNPASCATACDAYEEGGFALCEPACDLLAQDCPGLPRRP